MLTPGGKRKVGRSDTQDGPHEAPTYGFGTGGPQTQTVWPRAPVGSGPPRVVGCPVPPPVPVITSLTARYTFAPVGVPGVEAGDTPRLEVGPV